MIVSPETSYRSLGTRVIWGNVSSMLRISSRCILACGFALAAFFPLSSADAQHGFGFARYHETLPHSFCSQVNCADGYGPVAGVIMDSSGNLYGTTWLGGGGGTNSSCFYFDGCGTVFRVAPNGTETVLYAFQGGNNDGANPEADVIMDSAGNLYGTTLGGGGGSGSSCNDYNTVYCGTVFKLTPSGKETVLHAFQGGSDGGIPRSNLIMDNLGNLYGTTQIGGGSGCGGYGCGTIFKLSADGTETVLYSFKGGADGSNPTAGLIMDSNGSLYGTTYEGGPYSCGIYVVGCGTVFKLAPSGKEKVLHAFQGGSDGSEPVAGVIMDSSGRLFGTTENGGGGNCPGNIFFTGCGTVFKLSRHGKESVLYAFPDETKGWFPEGGLITDYAGNLYGTTQGGGNFTAGNCPDGCGTVFKISPHGKETVLYSFCPQPNCSDGIAVFDRLITDGSGNLYGTVEQGGANGYGGAVFELTK